MFEVFVECSKTVTRKAEFKGLLCLSLNVFKVLLKAAKAVTREGSRASESESCLKFLLNAAKR